MTNNSLLIDKIMFAINSSSIFNMLMLRGNSMNHPSLTNLLLDYLSKRDSDLT